MTSVVSNKCSVCVGSGTTGRDEGWGDHYWWDVGGLWGGG